MKKNISLVAAMVVVLGVSTAAKAEGFDQSNVYVGGGVASNTFGGESAFGFQAFAGYDLSEKKILGDDIGFSVELGYANSGDFTFGVCPFCSKTSSDGLWATAVADFDINDEYKFINRLGMDFGDADGTMMGMGVQYKLDEKISLRGELVMRGGFKSYQLNATYSLK